MKKLLLIASLLFSFSCQEFNQRDLHPRYLYAKDNDKKTELKKAYELIFGAKEE